MKVEVDKEMRAEKWWVKISDKKIDDRKMELEMAWSAPPPLFLTKRSKLFRCHRRLRKV
jgi:hypothetical protein